MAEPKIALVQSQQDVTSAFRARPYNVEAEQAVLGAVLGFGSLGAPSVVTLGGFVIMFAGLGIWWRCARTLNDR